MTPRWLHGDWLCSQVIGFTLCWLAAPRRRRRAARTSSVTRQPGLRFITCPLVYLCQGQVNFRGNGAMAGRELRRYDNEAQATRTTGISDGPSVWSLV